jgi:hypothetical protein
MNSAVSKLGNETNMASNKKAECAGASMEQNEMKCLVDTANPETETPPCNRMYQRYQDLVGNTPLLDLSHMVKNEHGVEVRLFAKAEFMNPGFSIKDRIMRNILNKAEASGALVPGATVVAASSGEWISYFLLNPRSVYINCTSLRGHINQVIQVRGCNCTLSSMPRPEFTIAKRQSFCLFNAMT